MVNNVETEEHLKKGHFVLIVLIYLCINKS